MCVEGGGGHLTSRGTPTREDLHLCEIKARSHIETQLNSTVELS